MLTGEEQRMAGTVALLHLGFRPFFLGAGVFAVLSVLIWTGLYSLGWNFEPNGLPPVLWHAHEMIYGYSMAVVAGFLLTAVNNWTGVQTLHGYPLLILFLLWATARILAFTQGLVSLQFLAVVDNAFIAVLVLAVTYPVAKVRQWKQIGIVSKLVLMLISNSVFYLGVSGVLADGVRWGLYSGLYLLLALIFAIGRRVIPFFVEKGVGYPVQLKNWRWLDVSSLVLFLAFWVVDVFVSLPGVAASLAGILAILHAVRLVGWYTRGIWKKPLLWVLFLGYGSLIVGFVLKLATFSFGVSPYLSVHAFAFGGIAMMTLGMMARVSLGHTGRSILEPPAHLSAVFAVLYVGVVMRVFLPLIDPGHYSLWIALSQVCWIVSFSIFLYVYTPMLVRPRIDGRYG
jgi:uncharacterized protein involved in response to NO